MTHIDLGRQGKDFSLTAAEFATNSIPSSALMTSTANTTNGVVVLDSLGRLPALDGSQLFNVSDCGGSVNFVDLETPSGTVNGVNLIFTLSFTPVVGSVHLYTNGLLQKPGIGNDFVMLGTQITCAQAPITGSVLLASYRR